MPFEKMSGKLVDVVTPAEMNCGDVGEIVNAPAGFSKYVGLYVQRVGSLKHPLDDRLRILVALGEANIWWSTVGSLDFRIRLLEDGEEFVYRRQKTREAE